MSEPRFDSVREPGRLRDGLESLVLEQSREIEELRARLSRVEAVLDLATWANERCEIDQPPTVAVSDVRRALDEV